MPAPDKRALPKPEMTAAIANLFEPQIKSDLAYEVQELRKEIAALRNELKPVPSMIATGQQVLDEFRRIAVCGNEGGVTSLKSGSKELLCSLR